MDITENKCCQATPYGTLLEQVINASIPKSEREWAARREILMLREALEEIQESAEEHPVFMGYEDDISEQDICDEGGDAAFVTLDIAWKAKKALGKHS